MSDPIWTLATSAEAGDIAFVAGGEDGGALKVPAVGAFVLVAVMVGTEIVDATWLVKERDIFALDKSLEKLVEITVQECLLHHSVMQAVETKDYSSDEPLKSYH